jgi:hypothetical protein
VKLSDAIFVNVRAPTLSPDVVRDSAIDVAKESMPLEESLSDSRSELAQTSASAARDRMRTMAISPRSTMRHLLFSALTMVIVAQSGCSNSRAPAFKPPLQIVAVLPGNTITLPVAGSFDIVGLDGESMGGIHISGYGATPTIIGGGGSSAYYVLSPNDVRTNQSTHGGIDSTLGMVFAIVPSGTSTSMAFDFDCPSTNTGGWRLCNLNATVGTAAKTSVGAWTEPSTKIFMYRVTAVFGDGSPVAAAFSAFKPGAHLSWNALQHP